MRSDDERWPALDSPAWGPTRQTLHRYLQIVGKIRMALVPSRHHWEHTTLRPAIRGLTTGPMPCGHGELEISFDLVTHRLVVLTSDGRERSFALGQRPSCADFYADLFAVLDDLGLHVSIRPVPYDLGEGPAFAVDTVHRSYDAAAVRAYWRVLAGTERVLTEFASRFAGEASQVLLFWHLLDLSYTRHTRTTSKVNAEVTEQVIGFGFTPGDERGIPYPAFFSSTAPDPGRLVEHELAPEQARWTSVGSGHRAVLAYEAMRASSDPDRTLLAFFESAYLAGARASAWDVAAHSRVLPRTP
jgi:hypothetical protein